NDFWRWRAPAARAATKARSKAKEDAATAASRPDSRKSSRIARRFPKPKTTRVPTHFGSASWRDWEAKRILASRRPSNATQRGCFDEEVDAIAKSPLLARRPRASLSFGGERLGCRR